MANPFTLAVTLPPFLFDGSQTEKKQPVVSATYTPEDYKQNFMNTRHLDHLESINRAVMSGRRDMADNMVEMAKDRIAEFHQANMERFKTTPAEPILGMQMSLKTATAKHQTKSTE
jgi:hypothetical protein